MKAVAQSATNPLAAFDRVLDHTTVEYLDRARAYPFIKWVGGKRSLVPEIVKQLPHQFSTYWEPFVGGGAVFFSLDSRIRAARISDANMDLILTYTMVRDRVDDVIDALEEHATHHGKDHYKNTRNTYHTEQDPVQLAAQFIYLNKTGYNGLYRVNKQGKFNVPMGSYKNPNICDSDNLRAASEVLAGAVLTAQSFTEINPEANDLVYCDPPYDRTFTGYNGAGFTADDQKALADACIRWRESGAYIIASNSDTPLIRSLYSSFTLHTVNAPRNVSCKASSRGSTSELLIVG